MQRFRDKKILITGVSRFPANKFVKFFDSNRVSIVGVDVRFPTFNPPSMRFYETDPYFLNIENIIRAESVDTVIHLMCDYDIYSEIHAYNRNNLIRYERLMKLFSGGKIKRLILTSSIFVYGVNFSSDRLYSEEDTLISSSRIAYLNDMLVMERNFWDYIQHNSGDGLFLFRSAPLYHNFSEEILIKFFKKTPVIYSIARRDPEFQFLYILDFINYIINALFSKGGGVYNIASSDTIRLSEIANRLNKAFVYVPENVFRGIFVSVERFLKSEMFATELVDMLSFPCLVSIDKARKELGYEPEYKVKDIVENITFFD